MRTLKISLFVKISLSTMYKVAFNDLFMGLKHIYPDCVEQVAENLNPVK